MPVLTQLDPPGGVKDLASRPALRKLWSQQVSDWFDAAIERIRYGAPKPQFYNPLVTPTDPGSAEKEIAWLGFPQVLLREANGNRRLAFQRADRNLAIGQERNHDEYLEWHVTRDRGTGAIVRVVFTTEPPEYYDFLSRSGEAGTTILLKLYRKYVSSDVALSDIIVNGVYNPLNRWNSHDGAMHLTNHSNSLQAELNLAADGTIRRRKGTRVLSDAQELIECAKYGEPLRASDPRIGADVNALAREGFAITLKNPVGLTMKGINTQGWTKPDGTPIGRNYFKVVRGRAGSGVRAVFEVPAGETSGGRPFTVGDILIGGQQVRFGGQVAEAVTVKLVGVATRQGSITNAAVPCARG